MIIFKKISYKNFLSTGNSVNTILLNKSHSTLVIGKNGEGKSTMLDALCYVLFGKPFRNINKPQLINSINGKQLLVEIEFSIGPKEYKVVRGMKPNIFEIWCDNVMLNQDAAVKDYQKVLEQQILRLNYKTFTQVVILGAASFVPFMQLPAAQRRDVIEDILDIRIFSVMNQILKDRINENRDLLSDIETKIDIAKRSVEVQKKLIGTLVSSKRDQVAQIERRLQENQSEIEANNVKQAEISEKISRLMESASKFDDVETLIQKANRAHQKLLTKKEQQDEVMSFFLMNETCPSCSQGIPHEHKESVITKIATEQTEVVENISTIEDAYNKLIERQKELATINREITMLNAQCNSILNANALLARQNVGLQQDIASTSNDTSNIDTEKLKLKEIADEAVLLIERKTQLYSEKQVHEVSSLLLKDTGIKTAIIREYLPVMNKLINKYLNVMDSYIHFELDESFNEVIKSRFRDEFTYASFSEGEKQRIDLAILFTWRQIAKMKNSVNTNLLIFDEIMDSSLDTSGTEAFMSMLDQFGLDTNIFVISHKGDMLFDKFHSVLRVEKKNDFSVIV